MLRIICIYVLDFFWCERNPSFVFFSCFLCRILNAENRHHALPNTYANNYIELVYSVFKLTSRIHLDKAVSSPLRVSPVTKSIWITRRPPIICHSVKLLRQTLVVCVQLRTFWPVTAVSYKMISVKDPTFVSVEILDNCRHLVRAQNYYH